MTEALCQAYTHILKRELVPAMGCTEPIAVAYCAAKARELLGRMPRQVEIFASGNIIKNVKSVIVPHTGGARGLCAAAAVGVFYGDPTRQLEVLSAVTPEQEARLATRMDELTITVTAADTPHPLDLCVTVSADGHTASVHIRDAHTRIVEMRRDGENVFHADDTPDKSENDDTDLRLLNVADIKAYADTVPLEYIAPVLERQIACNTAIAKEGLENPYGARIGQVLLRQDDGVRTRAKAMAAAGSDARMGGCDMPVVINSGSGNQGMTASLPVIAYAEHHGKTHEELLRALALSNLITLHLKSGIGCLSAYCGAVSAGVGAGAGIAYLLTGDLTVINHTIVNAIAIASGIVCDGAKASCAAKIAMAVEAGLMGFEMYREGCEFYGGDGLVSKGVEATIRNIAVLGNEGMRETDRKIIELMTAPGC